jgi:hypothetical protein
MPRSTIGLAVACVVVLVGACDATVPVVPEPERSPSETAGYTPERLQAAMPSAQDLPAGYKIENSCRAPRDHGCEVEGAPDGVYNVVSAAAGVGTRRWGLRDSIHLVSGTFTSPEQAREVVREFEQKMRRDFTGAIDVEPRTEHGTALSPGEKGTGALEPFSSDRWRGALATKTTRIVDAGGKTSPPATYASIMVSHDRTMLSVSSITWSGRLEVEAARARVRMLFEEYLDRLDA